MNNKITFLGVGNGGTEELYNTCFVIQNESGNFLVDTGGSIEIMRRLKSIGINPSEDVKNIFISHSHTDHLLGLIWMFKKIGRASANGEIESKINLYCNDIVYTAIMEVAKQVLPKKLVDGAMETFNFHILEDGEIVNINGIDYKFFDIKAKGTKQYGFEYVINNKKVVFLGYETFNPELSDIVRNSDYVMHEAFCLDAEEPKFKAYQKHHSTTKSASEVMNTLNVKNLILYHTEESHGKDRKRLYEEEAQSVFNGNVIVPNDMETIIIE